MDQSYSEGDLSMSPSQVLERQMLRHLQLLQRGTFQQQNSYNSAEESTTATEIVSHFSNSTSYNTFRTLLDSSQGSENEELPQYSNKILAQRKNSPNIIEGVSILNLSQESEYITNSPVSTGSVSSKPSVKKKDTQNVSSQALVVGKKQISLDEMPIISPRKDFESLIMLKMQAEKVENRNTELKCKINSSPVKDTKKAKRPYLKRGEGMSRFGIKKHNLIIQNTKSLPWKQRASNIKINKIKASNIKVKQNAKTIKNPNKLIRNKSDKTITENVSTNAKSCKNKSSEKLGKAIESVESIVEKIVSPQSTKSASPREQNEVCDCDASVKSRVNASDISDKKPLALRGKTWATVLSKEQNDFLMQLKQSDYYKNFHSPAKSTISDISSGEYYSNMKQDREIAEQNLFELMEQKVTNDSFNLGNSFFNKFLGRNVDDSGESTPLILKKCISDNPKLTHLSPSNLNNLRCEMSYSDVDNCNSECIECSETCSSVSSCCSCKTVTQTDLSQVSNSKELQKAPNEKVSIHNYDNSTKQKIDSTCQVDCVITNEFSVNMAEMNAKLIATSDLLKDRLRELEDEIETFRKENLNLNRVREELDLERQNFYEEKKNFEQKFNEEKILSEYYLAEEKEKLQKQKQIYEKYVRDIRGRLNKKEKEEVVSLKNEIQALKEEIRTKEGKSTLIIARLRNQIKLIEKEKKNLIEETEKLKKENRRIQHSNEITRRLTNLKYLENINKKLSNMATKDIQIDVVRDPDIKYKSYTIERQSRSKLIQSNEIKRPRAKSVPNLNVTSRYAKYFSQKDSLSDMEKQYMLSNEPLFYNSNGSDDCAENLDVSDEFQNQIDSDEDNNLEQIYNERFKETVSVNSTKNNKPVATTSPNSTDKVDNQIPSDFFIRQSRNNYTEPMKPCKDSISPHNYSVSDSSSPHSFSSSRLSNGSISNKNKSTETPEVKENHNLDINVGANSSSSRSSKTLIKNSGSQNSASYNRDLYCDSRLIPSPEPTSVRSNTSKTKLSPIETTKPDGSRELKFPNGNVKIISADGKYSKFIYYNGDIKENFYKEGKIKYFYAETKTHHTSHADGLEILEFPDGQIEKRYKDGSTEIRLPNGSVRYYDPKNKHVQEEWRFPDGATLIVSASGEQRIKFANGQIEIHAKDHKRREFPDGTVKLVYNDGTSETRYASGRIRIKDKHGNLIMDSAPG